MVLLHRDQRRDVATADWASLLGLNEFFAAVLADAEMAAWHYKGVLLLAEADEALGLGIVIDHLLAFFCAILVCHAVD